MSDEAWAAAENERKLANLIQIGRIAELNEAEATVRVQVSGSKTDFIPWVTNRAGATRTWSAPRVGEQVLVLAPHGDLSQAIVLPSIYRQKHPAPANSKDLETTIYPDGSTVEYNSASNTLTVTVTGSGNVIVNCQKATVNASSEVTLNTPETKLTGNLTVQGTTSTGSLISRGDAGSGSATITGGVQIINGSVTHNGKNIGSTHTHTGVQGGGGVSGVPS